MDYEKKEIPLQSRFPFIGLMNNDGEPKVIEYNVRMEDPEDGGCSATNFKRFSYIYYSVLEQVLWPEYKTEKYHSITQLP